MPVSSPRSSGWRATAWIIEPKMFPIPMPAPTAPSPTPTPNAIALPRSATLPLVAARSVLTPASLVCGFDGAADVDGGEKGEDEGLDRDDDADLEDVDHDRDGDRDDRDDVAAEDENQAEHDEDEHVARKHVREEPDG